MLAERTCCAACMYHTPSDFCNPSVAFCELYSIILICLTLSNFEIIFNKHLVLIAHLLHPFCFFYVGFEDTRYYNFYLCKYNLSRHIHTCFDKRGFNVIVQV